MSEKIAVVTGGNKGIGYAIVRGLCEKFNGQVYLTARDIARGEAAINKLKALGFHPQFYQLDINDEENINEFKEYLQEKHGGIDLLVNNSAIEFKNDTSSELFSEHAKTTIAVNYFSTLKLSEALFPLLRDNARIVNVSSSAGHLSMIPSADLRAKFSDPTLTVENLSQLMEKFVEDVCENKNEEEGWGNSAYVVSKVGVSALTIVQQREFDKEAPERNISINCCHPGLIDPDPFKKGPIIEDVDINLPSHKGPLTSEVGAKAPLYLALEDHNLKGQYVWLDTKVVDWYGDSTPDEF